MNMPISHRWLIIMTIIRPMAFSTPKVYLVIFHQLTLGSRSNSSTMSNVQVAAMRYRSKNMVDKDGHIMPKDYGLLFKAMMIFHLH